MTGTYLGGSKTFATILHIAGEEHVQVAAHDEVMFRTGWKAQRPDVMALRISEFIKRFGSDPGVSQNRRSSCLRFSILDPIYRTG